MRKIAFVLSMLVASAALAQGLDPRLQGPAIAALDANLKFCLAREQIASLELERGKLLEAYWKSYVEGLGDNKH